MNDHDGAMTEDASGRDRHFVSALARGLRILRCFSAERPSLGTSEIARLTGLPQPTVWRACHTLLRTGYLVPDGTQGRLRLGAGCLALGHAVLATQPLTRLARDMMQPVADRGGLALALGERDGDAMIMTVRVQGPSNLLLHLPVGSRMPILSSVLGWAYLAVLTPEERHRTIETLRPAEAERWHELGPAIETAVAQHATHGYLVNRGFFHPRVVSVGAAFRAPDGHGIYAVNCGGPSSQIDDALIRDDLGPTLLRIAADLRAALPGPSHA